VPGISMRIFPALENPPSLQPDFNGMMGCNLCTICSAQPLECNIPP
jgi:hypothetical protein